MTLVVDIDLKHQRNKILPNFPKQRSLIIQDLLTKTYLHRPNDLTSKERIGDKKNPCERSSLQCFITTFHNTYETLFVHLQRSLANISKRTFTIVYLTMLVHIL